MNSELMDFSALSHAIGARRVSNSQYSGFSSVAIDSRNVKEGTLFFALKGNVSDGHSFVGAAFNAGARAAVVESSKLDAFDLINIAQKTGKELIVVENTLKALQDSAKVYLEMFPKLIKAGLTGSSGKTTTKEITAAIISNEKNTIMNQGNLNSETGLPLSVFEVRSFHEAGVFELGMNRKGEISEIANVLKPNIATITNIGTSHIGMIGSKHEILNEKKNIFNYLAGDDIALIPENDEYAKELANGVNARVKFYGADSFDELEGVKSLGLDGTELVWAGEKIRFALPGKHNLDNALAAIAIAKEISISSGAIKKGLESVKPLFGRLEILKGQITVIRDCYNANPESTAKAIEFCDSLEWQGRKIYVIGEMLELGAASGDAHAKIGASLSASKADGIFLFGKETEAAASYLASNGGTFFHTNNMEELIPALKNYVKQGDIVLLKGSRGCALERITETGGLL
ncbi:MAG: UDP-N-acetylmuramoyl-tripeptide--D-alanyl-D-alanine ligase [Treponema sp.]|jgi:UDP-N-acetylmuramoyl-tripeptide--D-alanyl-D-alanine ligase|nr:UDP-N-acetylmuramoyl-tripeptide--D-alanyl-D-alanine ligase [Treponema sp.]